MVTQQDWNILLKWEYIALEFLYLWFFYSIYFILFYVIPLIIVMMIVHIIVSIILYCFNGLYHLVFKD